MTVRRCLVCGDEWPPIDDDLRFDRDEATGALIPPQTLSYHWILPDGAWAGACHEHTPDEVRAAFVLAERTLTCEPTA